MKVHTEPWLSYFAQCCYTYFQAVVGRDAAAGRGAYCCAVDGPHRGEGGKTQHKVLFRDEKGNKLRGSSRNKRVVPPTTVASSSQFLLRHRWRAGTACVAVLLMLHYFWLLANVDHRHVFPAGPWGAVGETSITTLSSAAEGGGVGSIRRRADVPLLMSSSSTVAPTAAEAVRTAADASDMSRNLPRPHGTENLLAALSPRAISYHLKRGKVIRDDGNQQVVVASSMTADTRQPQQQQQHKLSSAPLPLGKGSKMRRHRKADENNKGKGDKVVGGTGNEATASAVAGRSSSSIPAAGDNEEEMIMRRRQDGGYGSALLAHRRRHNAGESGGGRQQIRNGSQQYLNSLGAVSSDISSAGRADSSSAPVGNMRESSAAADDEKPDEGEVVVTGDNNGTKFKSSASDDIVVYNNVVTAGQQRPPRKTSFTSTSRKNSTWDVCTSNSSHYYVPGGLFHSGNYAWITFASTASYLPGVFALFGSLKRQRPSFSEEHGEDFVLLVTCGVMADDALLFDLCGLGVRVLRVCDDEQQQTNPLKGDGKKGGSLAALGPSASANDHQPQPQTAVTNRLPKLNVFRVACLYQRIIYVDADMVFLKDPGELLRIAPTVFHAAEGQVAGRFNSGLFVHDYDGGATWTIMEEEIAGLGSCTDNSCKYWDRMSKRVADQGFLNGFFDGSRAPKWRKLGDKPYQYNAKLIFYVMGRVWGVSTRPVQLDRSKVVALHWIGDYKPWQIAANYPCGNTKKYCFCEARERQRYRHMLDVWWDDYQIGKLSRLDYNVEELKQGRPRARKSLFTRKHKILTEMSAKHTKSQFQLCPEADRVWTMPGQLGPSKTAGRTTGAVRS